MSGGVNWELGNPNPPSIATKQTTEPIRDGRSQKITRAGSRARECSADNVNNPLKPDV